MTTDNTELIATDVTVEYTADAGRYILVFENPDEAVTVSFPPYRMAAMLEQIFEEGKWASVPDLDAMTADSLTEAPTGLTDDDRDSDTDGGA